MQGVTALWWREIIRFVRQRSRLVGAFAQPLLFWVLLGGGFSASLRPPGAPEDLGTMAYFYPGIIGLVLLFTAIFSTIAVVEDRKSGFLQGVMVSPISRAGIVLGQALGGTTLAVIQGVLFLALAPLVGIALTPLSVVAVVLVIAAIAFALTSLGLVIAWRMESTQGFHAIMNLLLLPIWFLSGAFFPATDAPAVLRWVMQIDPLTYGLAALRHSLYLGGTVSSDLPALGASLAVSAIFGVLMFAAATAVADRSGTL
jgi:ABC-2 type transport system permease protein